MPRNLLSMTSGVLLLGLLFIFSILAWNRDPQGVATQQVASGVCLSASDAGFVFDFYGYVHNEDGTTTLTYSVTDPNKKDISYVAFGTGDWERVEPSDGVTTTLELGTYQVEWTNDRGNPGFTSVKYETQFGGFNKGATEMFTLVVNGFDPDATVQVEAKAGRDRGRVSFALDDPSCNKTPPTPTPTPPFSPLPTPTPTPEGGVILPTEPVVAECVFGPPAGGMPPDEPVIPLGAYTFSEPTLILTNTAPIEIHQWLPDNETLLVQRHTGRGSVTELLNALTSEMTSLIRPEQSFKNPRWLAQDSTLVWGAASTANREGGYWIHSFEPPGERQLASDWGSKHDVSPNGKEFIFLSPPSGSQPIIWNQETKELRALPVDLADWRYQNGPIYPLRPFRINWHPQGDKILFWDSTWTFLYDLNENTGCEIAVRKLSSRLAFVHEASWSPNGRYLLLNVGEYPPGSTYGPVRMLLFDLYTGESKLYPPEISGDDFSWAPDSQTVAMSAQTGGRSGIFDQLGIYLLNTRTSEYQRIMSGPTSSLNHPTWSADGSRLAFYCQDYSIGFKFDDYRVCISQVSMTQ